jgi:hypothetical protein
MPAQVEKDEKEKYDAQVAKSELGHELAYAGKVDSGSGPMASKVAAAAKAETPKDPKGGKLKRPSEGNSGPKRKKPNHEK